MCKGQSLPSIWATVTKFHDPRMSALTKSRIWLFIGSFTHLVSSKYYHVPGTVLIVADTIKQRWSLLSCNLRTSWGDRQWSSQQINTIIMWLMLKWKISHLFWCKWGRETLLGQRGKRQPLWDVTAPRWGIWAESSSSDESLTGRKEELRSSSPPTAPLLTTLFLGSEQ